MEIYTFSNNRIVRETQVMHCNCVKQVTMTNDVIDRSTI